AFNGTAGVAPVFSGPIPDQTWINGTPVSLDTSTYFGGATEAVYALATGSLPTSVTLNTSTGLISGTPLIDSNATFSVSCTNALAADTSNVVNWAVTDVVLPAFYALTPDTANDYLMEGVLIGTGGLTTTHTADLYAPDFNGVYQKFPANAPVWSGGRCVLTGAAGTDVVSVHANDAPAGTPLSDNPYLQYYPAAENEVFYSNNITGPAAGWTVMAGAESTFDQIGLTGEPNTASLVSRVLGLATESAYRAVTLVADTN
ncbi:unnamed protein product, partial [marine sediment metagenome]